MFLPNRGFFMLNTKFVNAACKSEIGFTVVNRLYVNPYRNY